MATPDEHCPICYDAFDLEQGEKVELVCRHNFCRPCLQEYCLHSVSVQKLPIMCPSSNIRVDSDERRCPEIVPSHTIRDVLLPEAETTWIKFSRLMRLSRDSSLIPCPKCDEPVNPNDDDSTTGTKDPALTAVRTCSRALVVITWFVLPVIRICVSSVEPTFI
jgi:hypothetical protein